MAEVDHARIAQLERELLDARRAGFKCPSCEHDEYEARRIWRGGDQKENSGEWYHYWACSHCGHDVTQTVAPVDRGR